MITGPLISDELDLPQLDAPTPGNQAPDFSRVLAELLLLRGPVGEAVDPAELIDGLIPRRLLKQLLSALGFRDAATVRHARNVAKIAAGVGRFLGWEGVGLRRLEIAALLHDVGKIGIPDSILFKPGKLSGEEADLLGLHPQLAVNLLQVLRIDPCVIEMIRLASADRATADAGTNREAGLGGRILAVADAYESMSVQQVFRAAMSHEQIIHELSSDSNRQFDTSVIEALQHWFETEGKPQQALSQAENPHLDQSHQQADTEQIDSAAAIRGIFSQLYQLENLYDGFYLIDNSSRIALWSSGCEQLLGFRRSEMNDREWSPKLLVHSEANQQQPLDDRELPLVVAYRSGRTSLTNVRIQDSAGEWQDVELQSVPLFSDDGQLQGVAQVLRAVSDDASRSQAVRELQVQATMDSLTQVANRGELEKNLRAMLKRYQADPQENPVSVIFLDIDHFKAVNDTHGHATGDEVLVEFARLLRKETYSGETIGRYGGEEFVVLCPETELQYAVRRSERLRAALNNQVFANKAKLQVTASFGVAEVEPGDTVDSLFSRADRALYLSKQAGRNCVTSLRSDDLKEPSPDDEAISVVAETGEFESSFVACTGGDMVVPKLAGFVEEHAAHVIKVSPDIAVLRIGQWGFLSRLFVDPQQQPVEMQIWFQEQPRLPKSSSSRVKVHVKVRPRNTIKDHVAFEDRAQRLFMSLRSYFAGE